MMMILTIFKPFYLRLEDTPQNHAVITAMTLFLNFMYMQVSRANTRQTKSSSQTLGQSRRRRGAQAAAQAHLPARGAQLAPVPARAGAAAAPARVAARRLAAARAARAPRHRLARGAAPLRAAPRAAAQRARLAAPRGDAAARWRRRAAALPTHQRALPLALARHGLGRVHAGGGAFGPAHRRAGHGRGEQKFYQPGRLLRWQRDLVGSERVFSRGRRYNMLRSKSGPD